MAEDAEMAEAKSADGFDASSHKMDLYSRAIAALGLDTMRNLGSLHVLIIGMRGVGVETAKNLILSGPAKVVIYDPTPTTIADLGANFYLREKHVSAGTSRAEGVVGDLSELNPYCAVEVHTGKLEDSFIQQFGAVVITDELDLTKADLIRINEAARTRTVDEKAAAAAFILAVTHGATGHFFSDFGAKHYITDADGEPSKIFVVDKWVRSEETIRITIPENEKRHGFDDGQGIRFEDINGLPVKDGEVSLEVLNDATGIKIKRIFEKYRALKSGSKTEYEDRERQVFNSFMLDLSEAKDAEGNAIELAKLGGWKTGGIVYEVKPTVEMEFKSLADSLMNPCQGWIQDMYGPPHPDQGAWERGAGKTVHLEYVTALEFRDAEGHYPQLHDEKDRRKFEELFKKINDDESDEAATVVKKDGAVDTRRVRAYSWYFNVELTGYCAFLGGIAAQEIVKKFGKYTPVYQWMHCDHVQLVGEEVPSDAIPQGSRYDHQISMFGKAFQMKLARQKIFLVGCGALGCEYLKGLAMMGVCCGPEGQLWCTDMDRIETSNLSRQFLFRNKHVGEPKSTTSSAVAKEMNPALNVIALEKKVWPETEDFFDDAFWDNLDLCWNALDNVIARKYTDSKCLWHGKPLLESGTQGTKCNSEVILPYKTKTYNDGVEQETDGIPMCTLQNFPYLPTHCIEWARSSFTGNFESLPAAYKTFVENSDKFFEQVDTAMGAERLAMVRNALKLSEQQTAGVSYETCVRNALEEFVAQHVTRIQDLVHQFPEDYKTEDEKDFWTGHKRFPQFLEKPDFESEGFVDYMFAASNLWAFTFGLDAITDKKTFVETVTKYGLEFPKWEPPKSKVKMYDEDDEKKTGGGADAAEESEIEDIIEKLKKLDTSKLKVVQVSDFEKDDDKNFHIDYITAVANMRAFNYKIKETPRHEVKVIAGKIIAALATTTAMITGLVELEFYKLKLGQSFIGQTGFYNANFNLSVPTQFQFFEPEAAIQHKDRSEFDEIMYMDVTTKCYPPRWTSWDKLVVNEGDITVNEFVERFPKLFWGVKPTMLCGRAVKEGKMLYTSSLLSTKMEEANLARDGITDKQRKMYEDALERKRKANEKISEGWDRPVGQRYKELYGELTPATRNYVVLSGSFEDAEGNEAELPPIKFIFA